MARLMKDSGIPWIMEIPIDWDIVNIRALFSFGKGLPITKENLREKGAPVVSYGQIHSKQNNGLEIKPELIRYVDVSYFQSNPESLVKQNDFIFADTSEDLDGCGNCVYVDSKNPIFAGYHTIILRNKTNLNLKYFAFLFQSDAWRKQIRERVTGVKLFSISQRILRETTLLLPPVEEQRRIVRKLSAECARIDAIIEQTRATVEEYKKLKQSIITQAVTKGIRPNRPMKDSGIEWIGEIPEEWEVLNLRNLFSFGKGLPITKDDLRETGISVISYGQIHSPLNDGVSLKQELIRFVDGFYLQQNPESIVKKNDFVFADTSEDLTGCGNCVYIDTTETVFAGYHTIILRNKTECDMSYFAFLFLSDAWRKQIRERVTGVKLFSISQKILKSTYVIFPPIEEQAHIANVLSKDCALINSIIEKKKAFIEELSTYKKSLIYEYVTGKKEAPL